MRAFSSYLDATFNRHAVKIQAGEYHVRRDETLIVTVLGSCVAVCLRDRKRAIGGMNHFMLPEPLGEKEDRTARYGVHAMDRLVARLEALGARVEDLEAKVFGAGTVIDLDTGIGRRNAEFALDYLSRMKIPVAAVDVGDVFPRKVYFSPRCGKVYVRRLKDTAA